MWSIQKVEELRAVVEDLEALQELNDELEENHQENEKQLLEEIGLSSEVYGRALLIYDFHRDQRRRLVRKQEARRLTWREYAWLRKYHQPIPRPGD